MSNPAFPSPWTGSGEVLLLFVMRNRNDIKWLIVILLVAAVAGIACTPAIEASDRNGRPGEGKPHSIIAPFDGAPKYPFTKDEAIQCGHWRAGSQDYPYFGAPRNGNSRRHAGVDLYPVNGAGTPVRAVRYGKVIRTAPFYTRRNGEITYAVLVDHVEFVLNYAELRAPALRAGHIVKQGQAIGLVSGTKQLHLELYLPGTDNWASWYDSKPPNLLDPTDMMTGVFGRESAAE
jgi:murein DD-endopeptidase MepM/ murein hydrolase activator NlpD